MLNTKCPTEGCYNKKGYNKIVTIFISDKYGEEKTTLKRPEQTPEPESTAPIPAPQPKKKPK